ncbi:MAG: VUT family protein [Bacilli bacterium]
MNKEFKRTFFTSLLAVLLVISNLIGLKLTNFFDLTISVDFLTFPFTFLCTLLIYNMGGKKKAYESILVASLIQIFIIISYTLAIKLGNQAIMPDLSEYVNTLFKVDEAKILSSLLAFLISHYVLIYIYENFKNYGKELFGVVISLLVALFLKATIYLVITLNGYDSIFIINMLLSNIIIAIILDIVITILFYLLREKEVETICIESMNINVKKSLDEDKTIEEIITKPTEEVKKTKKKTYYKDTSNKSKNNKPKSKQTNRKKTVKNSKVKVNKEDKK